MIFLAHRTTDGEMSFPDTVVTDALTGDLPRNYHFKAGVYRRLKGFP